MPRAPLHPAEQYARDVTAGRVVACKWVKLACKRHLLDLKHGPERGLVFDKLDAQRVLDFFSLLRHSKGVWAGQIVILEPWQQFILWCVFGWKRADGSRRFRTMYEEVARKNGKSTIAAGIGLYMLAADREGGAEVYSAATKRDQARITHAEAVRMVQASKPLSKRLKIYKDNIHIGKSASKYEPLGADDKTMDGLNVHCAVVDELHAHPNRGVWDKLRTGTRSRRQPLMVAITTAGFDRQSFCYEMNDYTKKVLLGKVEDDSFFGIIFTLDERDDWLDERNWVKANPNLGISKYIDGMREDSRTAKEMPSFQNSFKQLDLNIWVQSSVAWLSVDHWDKCQGEVEALDLPEMLAGQTCYAGLDLSSTSDLCAFVMVFPSDDDPARYRVICRFWVPAETVARRSHDEGVKYDAWVEEGYIEATPGNVIDYKWIIEQIRKDSEMFQLREIAYDRFGAANIVQTLQDDMGITVANMGQGFLSMSAPMKELERLVLSHTLQHGGNPVLGWMADNVVAKLDPAGNIKPDKEHAKEKIDGITALIMAIARAMVQGGEEPSVYESRGIVSG